MNIKFEQKSVTLYNTPEQLFFILKMHVKREELEGQKKTRIFQLFMLEQRRNYGVTW